jgi:hypothetical protein
MTGDRDDTGPERGGPGRPPSPVYLVHPDARPQNPRNPQNPDCADYADSAAKAETGEMVPDE